jgi:hypothetical protein
MAVILDPEPPKNMYFCNTQELPGAISPRPGDPYPSFEEGNDIDASPFQSTRPIQMLMVCRRVVWELETDQVPVRPDGQVSSLSLAALFLLSYS